MKLWKYKLIIKIEKKKHDRIMLSTKTKLSTLEVLISIALIDSHDRQDGFALVNNVWREYDYMKEKTQNPNIVNKYGRYNKILISENEVTGIDSYVKNNLIDSIGNMFLRVVFVLFDNDSTNIT